MSLTHVNRLFKVEYDEVILGDNRAGCRAATPFSLLHCIDAWGTLIFRVRGIGFAVKQGSRGAESRQQDDETREKCSAAIGKSAPSDMVADASGRCATGSVARPAVVQGLAFQSVVSSAYPGPGVGTDDAGSHGQQEYRQDPGPIWPGG